MSIIILSRGGTLQGLLLLFSAVLVAPIFVACAPFISSFFGVVRVGAGIGHSQRTNPFAGVSVEQGGKQLPSDEKSKALVLDSLLAFNKAVQDKSFAGFHQQISRRWQEQITPDKLKEVFNQFIETHLDISPIKEVQPVLSAAPQINSDGLLVLEGYYPTHPNKVYFRLKYVYEHPAWKVFGIQVNVNQ